MLSARCRKRLRIGVGHDKVDPLEARRDHVVDRVAAGAADADNGQARFDVDEFRQLKLDAHNALRIICVAG